MSHAGMNGMRVAGHDLVNVAENSPTISGALQAPPRGGQDIVSAVGWYAATTQSHGAACGLRTALRHAVAPR